MFDIIAIIDIMFDTKYTYMFDIIRLPHGAMRESLQ